MYILLDIGATKTRVGISKDGDKIGKPTIIPTPTDYAEAISSYEEIVREHIGDQEITAVGVGVAGPIDRQAGTIGSAPNLPWQGQKIRDDLARNFSAPVYLENDTALVGLGEAVVGAGRGFDIVAYITLSTGVNGVKIINGRIDKTANGYEIGHHIIDLGGYLGTKKLTTLESLVSGTNIGKRYDALPSKITDEKVWEEVARLVAVGLNNVAVFWSPDVIVLGGGMTLSTQLNVERIEKNLKEILKIFPAPPVLLPAELRDIGGLHGALAFIKNLSNISP